MDLFVATIFLLPSLPGIIAYIWVVRKMRKENVPSPPYYSYLVYVFAFGGLMFAATVMLPLFKDSGAILAWVWGACHLLFFPVLIFHSITINWNQRSLTMYHKWAVILGFLYFGLIVAFIVGLKILA